MPDRNRQRERRPLLQAAVNLDLASLQFDQVAHQCQSDAGAFMRARLRTFDAMESLEHQRQLIAGDADAGVADGQADMVAMAPEPNPDLAERLEGIDALRSDFTTHLLEEK